ncbi:hypothetical protein HHK36_030139 [Tetracentron sinense]|uniref:Uncharacterized protein n=1 Tax=Tetracentron sinense TaxID=13715 RepID=A0A835D0D5_TETSI|nr:hypothetical protein HHK36_030139 [Tetracentron sinense]
MYFENHAEPPRGVNREDEESCKDKIICIIADETMGWAVEVGKKMGIPQAAIWASSACLRALTVHIPELIDAGVIDANGNGGTTTSRVIPGWDVGVGGPVALSVESGEDSLGSGSRESELGEEAGSGDGRGAD